MKILPIIILLSIFGMSQTFAHDSQGDNNQGENEQGENNQNIGDNDDQGNDNSQGDNEGKKGHGGTGLRGSSEAGKTMEKAIMKCAPNPFNPAGQINYSVPSRTSVSIQVFDMTGKLIRNVCSGIRAQGSYQAIWPGIDAQGRAVSNGKYILCLRTENARSFMIISLVR